MKHFVTCLRILAFTALLTMVGSEFLHAQTTYTFTSTQGTYSNANYSFHIPLTDESGNSVTLWTNNYYSYSWAVFNSGPYGGLNFDNRTGGWTKTPMTSQYEPNTTGSVCNPAKTKCAFYSISDTLPAIDQYGNYLGHTLTFTFYGASWIACGGRTCVDESVVYAGEATVN